MTVTYSSEVANGSSFGCFWRILCKWRGSVYKLIWRELLAYLLIYLAINLVCRFGLNEEQKRSFEKVRQYCEKHSESIPMSFVLGFYVTLVVGRWWQQYQLLPWPDTLALFVSAAIPGVDEKGRLMRRNIVRCALLSYVITLQKVSLRVKKRFPSWQHMVDAAKKKIFDLMDTENKTVSKYWLPLVWATNIITRARKESLIRSDHLVQTILTELSDMRRRLGSLIGYDTVCLPLVYTQVVTLSVYSYFLAAIVGRQYITLEKDQSKNMDDLEIFFPFFTSLQFCFYIGWLKVAEVLINPFGEDDDDIELNWLIDRHLKAAYMIVDQMHEEHPELFKDQYWEEVVPKELPYTVASECYRKAEPKGSAENYKVKEADSIYSNLLAPTNPRKAHAGDDVYGEHPDLDYETVDTPMVGRKNWFQRQMHRMGSLRSTSTSYSSGRLFARTRHNSVYSSPESGIPITINGANENGTSPVTNAIIIPSQKMSFYDRLVGRKSSRGPQKKPVSLKNRPRIPTPDVTKEVMAQESKLGNPSPLSSNPSFVQSPASYPPEMAPVLHVMLSPIQELEGSSGVTAGAGSTAALAQAVLSPALTSAGLPPMAISSTPVTLTPVVSANQFLTSFMLTPTPTGSPSPTRANFHEGSRKITPPKSSVGITLTEVTSNSEDDTINAAGSNAGSIGSNSSGCNSASSTSTLPMADDRSRKISLNSQTASSPSSSAAKKKEVYV